MALRCAGRGEGHRYNSGGAQPRTHSGGGDYAYDQYTMPAPEASSGLMRTTTPATPPPGWAPEADAMPYTEEPEVPTAAAARGAWAEDGVSPPVSEEAVSERRGGESLHRPARAPAPSPQPPAFTNSAQPVVSTSG